MRFKKIKYGNDELENQVRVKKNDTKFVNKENFLTTLTNRLGDRNAVIFHLLSDKYTRIQTESEIVSDLNVARWEEVITTTREQSPSDRFVDLKSTIKTENLSASDFLEMMSNVPSEIVDHVEFITRGQSENPLWNTVRCARLTASSSFHSIKTHLSSTSDEKLVDSIVEYSNGNKLAHIQSLQWGKKHEKFARKRYVAYKKLKYGQRVTVMEKGLYLLPSKGFIGGSPDGIVHSAKGERRLLEIKCPSKWKHKTVTEACESKDFYCFLDNGEIKLKNSHKYHTQIQGLMAICNLQKCDFVVYTLKDIKIIEIDFNAAFWNTLLPKLEQFYTTSVIPRLFQK